MGTDRKHTEGHFKSNVDGLEIYYQSWQSSQATPRAVFITAHGLGEHSGRYQNPIDYFLPKGIAFYALDHRGHGKSQGKRGHVNHFDDYINDLNQFFNIVLQQADNKKIFMLGHSMGGLIALNYVLKHPEGLDGVLASGSLLKMIVEVSVIKEVLGKVFSKLMPGLTMKNELDQNFLSHDKDVVDAYINDPLVHDKVSARWFTEMLKALQETLNEAPKLKIPCLIMHGSDDKLTHPGGSKEFFKNVSMKDKTLKIYSGFYHEIFNEVKKDLVFKDIEKWLEGRL